MKKWRLYKCKDWWVLLDPKMGIVYRRKFEDVARELWVSLLFASQKKQ